MANIDKNNQSNLDVELFSLMLDRQAGPSLQAQLTSALRDLLLGGTDYSGKRLPASRPLAQELSVSRTTVTAAYDQLTSEGYLTARIGGGTYVAENLPHLSSPVATSARDKNPPRPWLPFYPGVPDQSLFPHKIWSRYLGRAWENPDANLLARPDLFGWYPLREAICDHLSVWRGLECRPEQIVVTSGASEAFDIILRGILSADRTVAIEDPGWPLMRDVLGATGAKVQPIRIDGSGFDATRIAAPASVAIVTPSRHYPTGIAMPLSRRMALIDWAQRRGGMIIEDDYDSEFRYQGHPLPSLAGLDGLTQSVYMGSFSKLLSPALRIGYLVLPETHVTCAKTYLARCGARASLVPQPALANFMKSGEFAVHLRRMRRTYAKRQAHLVAALAGLTDMLDVSSDPSGMHICVPFKSGFQPVETDTMIEALAIKFGLHLRSMSAHAVLPNPTQGFVLGYAAFDEETLSDAARLLTKVMRAVQRGAL